MTPLRIVVMGVAACGKSSVAAEMALRLGARYVEGDDHHLAASVEKMSHGVALTDDDRWPWLALLERELRCEGPVVVSCSALRKPYRDALRRAGDVRFVFLDVPREVIEQRIAARSGHFMGASMVASQFAALERPDGEPDVATVAAGGDLGSVVEQAMASVRGPAGGR